MGYIRVGVGCFFTLILTLPAQPQAASQPQNRLRVGAAKVDITPPASELLLPSDYVHDHLYARAIVVENGTTCAVLVGLDLGTADDAIIASALPRAATSAKCPAANFLISATHTHSASTKGLGVDQQTQKRAADAIVAAVDAAKGHVAPARIGFGTTRIDLNVNRDLYDDKQAWRQAPNPDGPSDKNLSVVAFIGDDNVPIGVYVNYAMHPINFYLSGVISADYPGEVCRYIEELFSNRPTVVFSQGTSGDQNPALSARALGRIRNGGDVTVESVGPNPPPRQQGGQGFNPTAAASSRPSIPPEKVPAYHQAIDKTGSLVTMEGTLIGASAVQLMRDRMEYLSTARIWGGQQAFRCPGRERLDAANPARENVFPGYKDGEDVNLKVGVLRIGDVNFATVNGEVYTNIGLRLKAASPLNKTIVVTLANGRANSGYIYSDDAYSHLSFQVIGSRLKPGCAESRIVSNIVDLMHRSEE